MINVENGEAVPGNCWCCTRGTKAVLHRYNRRKICSAEGRSMYADLRAHHGSGRANVKRPITKDILVTFQNYKYKERNYVAI